MNPAFIDASTVLVLALMLAVIAAGLAVAAVLIHRKQDRVDIPIRRGQGGHVDANAEVR